MKVSSAMTGLYRRSLLRSPSGLRQRCASLCDLLIPTTPSRSKSPTFVRKEADEGDNRFFLLAF
jgi:hypothetical protein